MISAFFFSDPTPLSMANLFTFFLTLWVSQVIGTGDQRTCTNTLNKIMDFSAVWILPGTKTPASKLCNKKRTTSLCIAQRLCQQTTVQWERKMKMTSPVHRATWQDRDCLFICLVGFAKTLTLTLETAYLTPPPPNRHWFISTMTTIFPWLVLLA